MSTAVTGGTAANAKLGAAAKWRGYFEDDAVFEGDMAITLVAAYEKACEVAVRDARYAVASGRLDDLRTAQWSECIVQTIEQILSCIPHGSPREALREEIGFERPATPKFPREA